MNVLSVNVLDYISQTVNLFFIVSGNPVRLYDKVWFQNRRAKFRKQERLAQQKATNSNGDGSSGQPNIKAENSSSTTKSNLGGSKDIKPGSPHSGISTTPNSNTSASSHQSSSNGDNGDQTNER
ncbi:hypothetical protein QE152_g27369 [Popillia japonica]|uniref:Homeobox domain-containing protein n=1 Tax=Popillia japonica TaxID=7064 RepID=A0AAW1JVG8_POPJA